MTTLTLNEAPPCEVTYLIEGEKSYAKLTKEDFENILKERRTLHFMVKLCAGIGFVAAIMAAGTAYWFTEHPAIKVTEVAQDNLKQ